MSMQLVIKNALILQSNGTFVKGHVGIDQGHIAALWYGEFPGAYAQVPCIDADGLLACPGLIDTHIHGGEGFGFIIEGTDWGKLEERLASNGVTSVLATGESLPPEGLLAFIDRAVDLAKNNGTNRVEILGIHMEGPYLNKNKKGCHAEEYIRSADKKEIARILERAGGMIKVWTLAPEFAENMAAIETLTAAGISVSIAHTEADYKTALAAFEAGANRVTHTFNTMPAISHRYEGIITAAWQYGAFMELIADGLHISPTIIKMFVSATDPGKIVLVSDNNDLSGMPDGNYFQNNQAITVVNGQLKTGSGNLAGSYSTLNRYAFNLTRWGFSPGAALKMVTENPARSIGVFDRKGSITVGKDADIAILNDQFEAMVTIKGGQVVWMNDTKK
ncbi:MAG: N-acetylglucosamine-6-phosphate deacetylase [Treponema sp.]|nr:N-acetylglucosamine-6-phosphate deacetylase [Treponema sp.]